MEQAKTSNISPGPCEKIFKAFNIIPAFKAMRRISGRPQSTSPLPGADPAPIPLPKTKLAAQQQPNSVVPVTIESLVHPTAPIPPPKTKLAAQQQPNSVVPVTIESLVHPTAPIPLPKTKLAAQQQPNSVLPVTIESLVHPTPTTGKVAVGEKKSDGQASRGTRNSEVTPSPVSLQKPKPGAEMPTPSKVTVGQNHGQEAKAPRISYQVKPVPQAETAPPAKPVVEKGQRKVVTGNHSVEADNKTVPNSGDHRFTEFINSTMSKIRGTSDVGKSISGPDGVHIKTKSSSNGGGGRSISFKK